MSADGRLAEAAQLLGRFRNGSWRDRARAVREGREMLSRLSTDEKKQLAVAAAQRVAPDLVDKIEASSGADFSDGQVAALVQMFGRLDAAQLDDIVTQLQDPEARGDLLGELADDVADVVLGPTPQPEREAPGAGATNVSTIAGPPPAVAAPGTLADVRSDRFGNEQAHDDEVERVLERARQSAARREPRLRPAAALAAAAAARAALDSPTDVVDRPAEGGGERDAAAVRDPVAVPDAGPDAANATAGAAAATVAVRPVTVPEVAVPHVAVTDTPRQDQPPLVFTFDGPDTASPAPVPTPVPASTPSVATHSPSTQRDDAGVRPSRALAPIVAAVPATGPRLRLLTERLATTGRVTDAVAVAAAYPDGWARRRAAVALVEGDHVDDADLLDLLASLASPRDRGWVVGSLQAVGRALTDDVLEQLRPRDRERLLARAAR